MLKKPSDRPSKNSLQTVETRPLNKQSADSKNPEAAGNGSENPSSKIEQLKKRIERMSKQARMSVSQKNQDKEAAATL